MGRAAGCVSRAAFLHFGIWPIYLFWPNPVAGVAAETQGRETDPRKASDRPQKYWGPTFERAFLFGIVAGGWVSSPVRGFRFSLAGHWQRLSLIVGQGAFVDRAWRVIDGLAI